MIQAAVITVSDRASAGEYEDRSGPAVRKLLEDTGYEVVSYRVIPDEKNRIIDELIQCCDASIPLVLTVGGTGFAPRDVTPEATAAVIEREAPGIAEYMRMCSMKITPRGMLSRGIAGIKRQSVILNLPGSVKASTENLSFVLPHLDHGIEMLLGMRE